MTAIPGRLIQAVKDVPSLPAAFSRLNTAVEDPRCTTRDIETIVREDAPLSGRLLRLANSAYFGFPGRVDTIARAITLVGTRQLRDLVLATSVIDMFKGVPTAHITMESYWQHSVACGLAARILASLRREPNPEQFFVAGLLHDIGRLIMYIQLSDDSNMRARMATVKEHYQLARQTLSDWLERQSHARGVDSNPASGSV
jgi:HD-like signal output (HDOD) protein